MKKSKKKSIRKNAITKIPYRFYKGMIVPDARMLIPFILEQGGGGGGYEPDGETIQLTKDLKLRVVDYPYLAKYNADGDFTGHNKFRGNIEVIYANTKTHYGANTIIRELPSQEGEDAPVYTYYLPDKEGTIALTIDIPTLVSQLRNDMEYATRNYVDSRVAATTKYIHKVVITGMSVKSPFTSTAEMTLIFVNKAANEINSFQAIVANYKNIVAGQIYDGANNKLAQLNILNITQAGFEFIVDNQVLGYSSTDFDGATFTDTTKDF